MKRLLLAIAAVLAIGSLSACASTASTGSSTPSDGAGDGSQPTQTLNDSFHYPTSD